ncbi:5-carboxymethyl-2-hydroxymuconate isomerase [Paracoccus sp. MBLB3053]|uniref:5-carboxymethyl-2-hydroxymuconate isomerase n=1 Tax=Paracoccus aurantius TaxID=3073814 RepID=A0ABU2HXW5_9RHOB|nr:5-carboxymethyl-2-hydroxymuconate isomerase [Paracoccus sp. MBLB3053]MDS9469898.1 5-carboxymethyl-2-hydroxymuconate isomerase [Paracoccus sp. MBLB3053]
MPHCIVEYSSNLEPTGRIGALLEKIAAHFRTAPEVFPTGGVRVRAIPVSHYVIADGNPEHAYVNVTCRIGAGRPADFRKAFFTQAFEIVTEHFAEETARRGLGITFYVDQADPEGSWKTNSIHAHMAKA